MSETTSIQKELLKNGFIVYTNKGVSMLPLIRQNRDLMIIESKKDRLLNKYDAVLFLRTNGQYVLHRILKVRENDYWIVGDNCVKGEFVKEEQIIGILTGVIRDGKSISVDNKLYQFYVGLWCYCYPIRFFLLRSKWFIRGKLGKVKRMIIRNSNNRRKKGC